MITKEMAKSNKALINEINAIKEENEKLEDQISFLRMENFDYILKCNHLENVLTNVNSITKNCAAKLLEASENFCQTIQLTTENKQEENQTITQNVSGSEKKIKIKKQSQSFQKNSSKNKAHVVNPHMVNGHILYVPTINLTRVPNLQTPNKSSNRTRVLNNSDVNNVTQESSSDFDSNDASEMNVDPADNTNEEESDQNQLDTIAEASEPSTSSARSPHSTLLSGTFQEVKIYLNQVGADSRKEESRKSPRKGYYASKNETSSPQNRNSRSSNSLGSVTLRKRN